MQPEALVKPEEAEKPEENLKIGILSRDTWSLILNQGSPNLWMTMQGVHPYFRRQYQFPWHLQGLNIRTQADFRRRMEFFKNTPSFNAVLGGQKTLEQAWIENSGLTNALDAMGITSLEAFHDRVGAFLRTLPQSDFYKISDILSQLQDQAFLIDYTALRLHHQPDSYITHAGLCMLLKGYISERYNYSALTLREPPSKSTIFAYRAVLTLFDEHYLVNMKGESNALGALLTCDPDNLLLTFRSQFLKLSDLKAYRFTRRTARQILRWTPSCLTFLCSNDGIAALQNGWITRQDWKDSRELNPQNLMKTCLARRYPDLFGYVNPDSIPNKLLEKLFDPDRPKSQHENLIALFRSQALTLESYKHLESSNIPVEDLLSIQELLKGRYLTTAQLDSLLLMTARGIKDMAKIFESLSRLMQLLGSPNSVTAFRDGVMTADKLMTTLKISGLQTTLTTLPQLFDNHAQQKTSSELNRLQGLKTQLSLILKGYTKHRPIFHRERATLLAKTLDELLPLEEMQKLVDIQLDLYKQPRRPFGRKFSGHATTQHGLFQGLFNRNKGWVEWTFHKTLQKCQRAIQEYQAKSVAVNQLGVN